MTLLSYKASSKSDWHLTFPRMLLVINLLMNLLKIPQYEVSTEVKLGKLDVLEREEFRDDDASLDAAEVVDDAVPLELSTTTISQLACAEVTLFDDEFADGVVNGGDDDVAVADEEVRTHGNDDDGVIDSPCRSDLITSSYEGSGGVEIHLRRLRIGKKIGRAVTESSRSSSSSDESASGSMMMLAMGSVGE